MIQDIFVWLSGALQEAPLMALSASLIWGVLSILLSPCHLSSIPLIVGFLNGQGIVTKKRAFILAGLFSIGILITIAMIGIITSLLGRILGDIGKTGKIIVSIIFFMIGLHLLEIITIPFRGFKNQPVMKRKGNLAAFGLGLIFGIALGPCTFAFMAPVLSIALGMANTRLVFAASLILFYAIGHCAVIVFAGTFTSIVQKYLNWNEKSKGAALLKKICGVLVILGGIYLIYSSY